MRRVRPLVALAIAGAMLLPGAATAAPSVSITGVTVTGDTGSVTGTATFDAIGAQSVVTEESSFQSGNVGGTPAGEAAGLGLTNATITPITGGLRFTWHLSSMPAQVPPEGVRYNWAFKIGTRIYQLQAKRTNMASVTTLEDPMGHVNQLRNQKEFFQLRGACVDNYTGTPSPVAGCYHLAWLDGAFNIEQKTVTMDLPYETRDSIGRLVAPDFKPGAVLVDNGGEGSAGMVIAASFQAVISNTIVSRYINGIAPYYVGPNISLGVAAPNQEPSAVDYKTQAVLNGSTFTGTVSGLSANKNTVFVRACNGTECSYSKLKAL